MVVMLVLGVVLMLMVQLTARRIGMRVPEAVRTDHVPAQKARYQREHYRDYVFFLGVHIRVHREMVAPIIKFCRFPNTNMQG
jgi:hypothetical protein